MQSRVFNISDENRPSDCVYIGRGSQFGNPFVRGVDGTRKEVIEKYIQYVEENQELKEQIIKLLKGKNLVCFCKPKPCHGDYLIKICNIPSEIQF